MFQAAGEKGIPDIGRSESRGGSEVEAEEEVNEVSKGKARSESKEPFEQRCRAQLPLSFQCEGRYSTQVLAAGDHKEACSAPGHRQSLSSWFHAPLSRERSCRWPWCLANGRYPTGRELALH